MSLLHRVGLLLAGAIVSSALVALPVSPAHADYDLGVTWPDVTQINPNVTDYRITVIDSGPGDLYARWIGGGDQPIPHNGSVDIDLGSDGEARVAIWRCVDGACEWAGVSSPVLSVHRSISLSAWSKQGVGSRSSAWSTHVYPSTFPGLTNLQYAWSLYGAAEEELASGAATRAADGTIETQVPEALTDGTYSLRFSASGDFVGGTLSSIPVAVPVVVDNTGPVVKPIKLSETWFFPNGGSDGLIIQADVDEPARLKVDVVTDADGSFVASVLDRTSLSSYVYEFWKGKVDGVVVDPGVYRVRFTATDAYGNESVTLSGPFHVDLATPQLVTKSVVVPAAQVIYDKYVGKCSALVTPSSHHWRDSLGYYSQARCGSDKNDAGVVLVWHAMWLPLDASPYVYKRLQVEMYGGPAKGRAKGSFMVMGYLNAKGRFSERVQFNKGLGWHRGHNLTRDFKKWFRYQDGRPYFVWSNGLSAGSRYDVKAFRVTAKAVVMVEPDGTIFTPPTANARLVGAPTRVTPGAAAPAVDVEAFQ